jgi:hypothetical protein
MSGIRETRTFVYPNIIVRVHFPDISDEENERRMKKLRKSAIAVMKVVIKRQ